MVSLDSHSGDHPGTGQERLLYSFLHLQGVPLFGHTIDYVCLLFGHIRLFVTPWTAARQASLSFTICQSFRKLMSLELMMSSNHGVVDIMKLYVTDYYFSVFHLIFVALFPIYCYFRIFE